MEVGILHVLKEIHKNFFRLLTIRIMKIKNYARSAKDKINKKSFI